MVEHVDIPDGERHELKGAGTASANQVPKANGSGDTAFGFVDWPEITNRPTIPSAAAFQADSTASDVAGVVADLNTLLSRLQGANLMNSS